MLRCGLSFGGLAVLAGMAAPVCALGQHSGLASPIFRGNSVSGTIVDADGIPQMGALVQLLLPDLSLAATALTDARGQYRIADLKPGSYRVRATAALFMPSVRTRVQLASGTRVVVNLTLSTLLATSQWLPVTRRSQDESDDWMWALRNTSMRPVLRLVDEDSKTPLSISTSAMDSRRIRSEGRISVESNTGGFARGGNHNVLTLQRQNGSNDTVAIRGDFSGARTPFPVAPSAELTLGWEKRMPVGGISRSTLTYTSHPELLDSRRSNGAQTAVLRNAERLELGDSVRVDVGSVFQDFHLAGNAAAMQPFLHVAFRPADGVVIAYTLTEARGLETLEDMDRLPATLPIAMERDGHLRLESGRHDALSLSGRTWKKGTASITAYRDRLSNPAIFGTGVFAAADLAAQPTLADPTTQSFAVLGRDYTSSGVRLAVQQPLSTGVTVGADFSDGNALVRGNNAPEVLTALLAEAAVQNSISAAVYADGKIIRTGTALHAGYRWQPTGTLTAVDPFHNTRESAYLNCKLRQSLRHLPMMPGGMEAVVSLQNLLAQGYEPFLSSDGRTLYLAQSPRVIQAGLAFTF